MSEDNNIASIELEDTPPPMAPVKNPAILYVEDDILSREVMRMIVIEVLGYKQLMLVEDSSNFEKRLESLLYKPDLILLDIHMLPISGFEMLEIIRQHAELKDVMVIALTASVMSDEVRKLRTAGFDGVIAKPINQRVFPDLLHRVLRGEQVWHIG